MHFIYLTIACFALSSCMGDRLKFWEDKPYYAYEISGLEDQEDNKDYVNSVMEQGLSKKAGSEEDNGNANIQVELTPNITLESEIGQDASGGVGVFWKWDY